MSSNYAGIFTDKYLVRMAISHISKKLMHNESVGTFVATLKKSKV